MKVRKKAIITRTPDFHERRMVVAAAGGVGEEVCSSVMMLSFDSSAGGPLATLPWAVVRRVVESLGVA